LTDSSNNFAHPGKNIQKMQRPFGNKGLQANQLFK